MCFGLGLGRARILCGAGAADLTLSGEDIRGAGRAEGAVASLNVLATKLNSSTGGGRAEKHSCLGDHTERPADEPDNGQPAAHVGEQPSARPRKQQIDRLARPPAVMDLSSNHQVGAFVLDRALDFGSFVLRAARTSMITAVYQK